MTILKRVKAIVAEQLGIDEKEVELTTDLYKLIDNLPYATELDFMEIIMSLEEKFGVKISDKEIDEFEDGTVERLISSLKAHGVHD